ncbi:immunity protein [Lactobacillus sp. ESL0785]|uniref:immunity protein n=1 Tax=Lactobacillus sp. ESL0785 TaxID=2983232 RepID=UPI0023F90935|nr:immunity protein [Lactobacillus sp. ESL0785]WEV71261.1 immunity protein [Lactobacillus sp. ESL0785]
MIEKAFQVILILLGIWELYAVYKSYQGVRKHGGKGTSAFLPLALWSGIVFGLVLIVLGLNYLFK